MHRVFQGVFRPTSVGLRVVLIRIQRKRWAVTVEDVDNSSSTIAVHLLFKIMINSCGIWGRMSRRVAHVTGKSVARLSGRVKHSSVKRKAVACRMITSPHRSSHPAFGRARMGRVNALLGHWVNPLLSTDLRMSSCGRRRHTATLRTVCGSPSRPSMMR